MTLIDGMRNIFLLVICVIFFSCASQKSNKNRIGYDISDSVTLQLNNRGAIRVKEIRFGSNFNCSDLQVFLFKKYGKWDNSIQSIRLMPVLVWENIKLLETSEELFTVAASGDNKKVESISINGKQKYSELNYCSAIVLNSSNVDCFQSTHTLKDSIAKYLISGANSISEKDILFEKELLGN